MQAQTNILSPGNIGNFETRNRVVLPGHTTNFGSKNLPTDRNIEYLARRAEGGVGTIITEAIRIHPSSSGRSISLGSFDDESVPHYKKLTDRIHEFDTRIIAQLAHLGRQANGDSTRAAPWSPSTTPWAKGAQIPHEMSHDDIRLIVDAFVQAAVRMEKAHFDGLEIHVGHGHLIQQFLSQATNQRTDKYGGSRENRLRFLVEILEGIFTNVSISVGLRVSVDEFLQNGMGPEDNLQLLEEVTKRYPISFIHASHSAYNASYSLSTQMADMHFPPMPFIEHASLVKKEFQNIPVIAVCRVDNLENANQIIEAGQADFVALARPHIADPDLVNKFSGTNTNPVRSCLACNQACIGRVEKNLPISCVVNPEVGLEKVWSKVVKISDRQLDRQKVVIGGGPAGMSAALVLANGGSKVTLFESQNQLGGAVRIAASASGRERLALSVLELEKLVSNHPGIDIHLGTRFDYEKIQEFDRSQFIVATGAVHESRHYDTVIPVMTYTEALQQVHDSPSRFAQKNFVIFDEQGNYDVASVAETFAQIGGRVHYVTPLTSLFPNINTYIKLNLLDRLRGLPISIHLMSDFSGANGNSVEMRNIVTQDHVQLPETDFIVDAALPKVEDKIASLLKKAQQEFLVIGDAYAPRTIHEAIFEGSKILLDLDPNNENLRKEVAHSV